MRSPRANGPFIKLHCAALAESLLESELFGHEKGAFTGAATRKDGRFTLADGGTLFLDEIGEISPATQVKLLRFLQEHEFERVGGTETLKVDVRIIAATNKNLVEEVKAGRFREDLYYRLNVVTIDMPPLRDRKADIPALSKFFVERYAHENNKRIEGIMPQAVELLMAYDWPGSVRELEHVLRNAWVLSDQAEIDAEDLDLPDQAGPDRSRPPPPSDSEEIAPPAQATPEARPPARQTLSSHLNDEKTRIAEALAACNWNRVRAAEMLGMPRRTFYRRLKQYQLQ